MAQVVPAQRWGVSAGPGPGGSVQLKNGWLPRSTFGWRINSIGHVAASGRDYAVAILSQANPTMNYGITTVESISRVVWRDLAPAGAADLRGSALTPGQTPTQTAIPWTPGG